MTNSVQQVWVCPTTLRDYVPLPALAKGGLVALYDRKEQKFGDFIRHDFLPLYATFDECRLAMIEAFTVDLADIRQTARDIAATIEHVKNIPSTPFPSDALQHDRQEEAVQEEAQAEEVKPAIELKRPRPRRR